MADICDHEDPRNCLICTVERERDEARAQLTALRERAEMAERERDALKVALQECADALVESNTGHYGTEWADAECSDSCSGCDESLASESHRRDLDGDKCTAHPDIDEADAICLRCIGLNARDALAKETLDDK